MTDRELLELAAKAGGYSHLTYLDHQYKDGRVVTGHYEPLTESCINPLTDDGDALRLAVKLGLDISWFAGFSEVRVETYHADFNGSADVSDKDDPYAATRLAIVRCAAGIGRSMK